MLIESVTVEAVGPFRERMVLGPLERGVNVLAQRNEWGKSTIVRALCHAFFDRYQAAHEGVRALRPAGSSLSPRVEVIFAAKGARHRLEKRFLDGKSCDLSRWNGAAWERTDESEAADQRLRELLGAPPLEGRTAKPETWGLVRFLWCRQDEPAEWPGWDGESGAAARRKLATVEIDSAVRELAKRLGEKAAALISPKSARVRAGSALEAAEQECERLGQELAEVRVKRANLEDLETKLTVAQAELPRLRQERAAQAEEAASGRAQAELVEKVRADLTRLEEAKTRADAALLEVNKVRDLLREIEENRGATTKESARLQVRLQELTAATPGIEQRETEARTQHREQAARRTRLAEDQQRMNTLRRWRELEEEAAALEAAQSRSRVAAADLAEAQTARTRLPNISAAKLKKWQELELALREDRARLSALGLRVAITPRASAQVVATPDARPATPLQLEAGATETVRAVQSVALELGEWGRLEIFSGAEETAALEAQAGKRQRELEQSLGEVGLGKVADAETKVEQARQLDAEIKLAEARLTGTLGTYESLKEIERKLLEATSARDQQRALAEPTAEEQAMTLAILRTEAERLAAESKRAIAEEARFAEQMEAARDACTAHARQRDAGEADLRRAKDRLAELETRQELLLRRYPAGLAPALEEAQSELVRAEARVADARRSLPPDAEKAQARAERAARAQVEADAEFSRVEAQGRDLEVELGVRGGEGLYSRQVEIEEQLESAQARREQLWREGFSARLLCELIQRREQSAIRHVLAPLEDRLSTVFASLTGIEGRRVWFNEHLQVDGVGVMREQLVPFDDLSRGAREQLLLALRAAIALELAATGEPQCLILDDVLVHTDAARHQNVLDYLQELGKSVQVLLLTCHAERYRGLGHALRPAMAPPPESAVSLVGPPPS